jgi:hypothetical protein
MAAEEIDGMDGTVVPVIEFVMVFPEKDLLGIP